MTDTPATPRWTAATALLAAALWVAQLAGGWEPPHRAGESFQNGQVGLTQVIESTWETGFRAKAPEAPSEPKALPGDGTASAAARAQKNAWSRTIRTILAGRAHDRPAIRAPPRPFFSL